MKILVGFLIIPFYSLGQTTFTGNVLNKNSKVPYATVALLKENCGINADENGYFSLYSKISIPNDTLIISCVGFVTQKIAVATVINDAINIQLAEQPATLDEVVVNPNYKWTTATLNEFADCGKGGLGSSGYLQQVAQHFVTPKQNSRLTKVRICVVGKSLFRLRVYDIDILTGGPGKDLCNQVIEIKSSRAITNFNVEQFNIIIPNNDFFVGIEWLKIPYNSRMVKHSRDGMEVTDILYNPSISWDGITSSGPKA